MDLDAFIAARSDRWRRLDQLAGSRRLDGAEADELVRLYQATATDLSTVRAAAPDPTAVTHLSQMLARARVAILGAHEPSWSDVTRFVVETLPAALYRIRWWSIGVTVACLALAAVVGVHIVANPEVLDSMMTPSQQRQYVEQAFVEYYNPGAGFAAMVWTNNAWIAAQCIGLGISGVFPVYVLAVNAANIGAVGGLMATHDALGVFFQLILPHGMLELMAVFVAGGAGLRLFWTLVAPAGLPRSMALPREGRATFTVALGLVGVLGVSGLIEGFVTGSAMPWWLKIAIGAVALAAFWVYTIVLGRRAVRAGLTGDLDADRAGYAAPVAG